jgi:RNA recognition motif-containing protein
VVLPYEKEIEPKMVEEPRNSNNLYVKFFPETWTESTLLEQFGCFGKISSVKLIPNKFGQ